MDALEAGSAVVLTYTAELDGLHAMFIPLLAPDIEQDGLSVYRESPEVDDAATAVRREKVTLVFESGGEFTVPASRLEWWNTATRSIETITLDAVTLRVDGPTPMEAVDEVPATDTWRRWAVGAGLILLAAIAAAFAVPRLLAWRRQREARIRASEAFAFRTLQNAIRHGDAGSIHAALLDWLARLDPPQDSRLFAKTWGDPGLAAHLDSISRSRFGDSASGKTDSHDLDRGLGIARKRFLGSREDARETALPRLNP